MRVSFTNVFCAQQVRAIFRLLTWPLLFIVFATVLGVGVSSSCATAEEATTEGDKGKQEGTQPVLYCSAEKACVRAGDMIVIREALLGGRSIESALVRRIEHKLSAFQEMDADESKFIQHEEPRTIRGSENGDFVGLEQVVRSTVTLDARNHGKNYRQNESKFTIKRPGVYVVATTWTIQYGKQPVIELRGSPVVIIVRK